MATNIYEGMTQQYKLSKTLRFELKPVGNTLDNIHMEGFLKNDKKRSEEYEKVKVLIDNYHRYFIDKSLESLQLEDLEEYYLLYNKANKDNNDLEDIKKRNENYRLIIEKNFKEQEEYENLFKDGLFKNLLPEYVKENKQYINYLDCIQTFKKFSTYFNGFQQNRKNIYTKEELSTSITYRIVNENLPIFISNVKLYKKNRDKIKNIINNNINEKVNFDDIDYVFEMNNFNNTLSQKGIDRYNRFISGYTKEDGVKVQGLNEIINLYNQKQEKTEKIVEFIKLRKQILSIADVNGIVLEKYENDIDLTQSVSSLYEIIVKECFEEERNIKKFFSAIEEYDLSKIYIKNNYLITDLSNELFENWSEIKNSYNVKYLKENENSKLDFDKYYKNIKYLNVIDIINTIEKYSNNDSNKLLHKFKNLEDKGINIIEELNIKYRILEKSLRLAEYNKKFVKNDDIIQEFKEFFDAAKKIQRFLNIFKCDDVDIDKDDLFYINLNYFSTYMILIDDVYNKVRNYLTQKPYSEEKYKLNFEKPTLLKGWDVNKEIDNLSIILRKKGKYYLGIINKNNSNLFMNLETCDGKDFYEKMEYKLLPGPNKMLPKLYFSKKGKETYNPSESIINGYNSGKHLKSKDFDSKFLIELIDFYKKCLSISHPMFNFKFKDSEEYNDVGEFYNDIEQQGYLINYHKISSDLIEKMIYENKLYLFEIYCKDFSKFSKGNKNLHTLYWEGIFSEENKENIIYKLDGEAELFYRPASLSISETTIHKAGVAINNKNENNIKKNSVFKYDLIKNRRYTEDKFMFHVPVSLNFVNKKNRNINELINKKIKYSENVNVIGIDRGERNLLYVSVINSKGEILEQHSLNEIITEYNGSKYKVDYHNLLDKKEKERKAARESWKTVNNIKELKEGYISIVINKIVNLLDKYNAIIVLEDLNYGFKNSRVKVEKQIYQKFEKALIEKLNFLVFKDKDVNEQGGLYNPYQLTNKFESFNKLGKQSGILFYVPAHNTSKIDPVTGFINRLYPKYESVAKSKEFIKKFDGIRFNYEKNYFEFEFDYKNFIPNFKTKSKWTICTYGIRLVNKINLEKNNEWDTIEIDITEELKSLFNKFNISFKSNLKEQILNMDDKSFYESLMYILKLTLQFRNSVTGTMEDYIISPVCDENGNIFVSGNDCKLPLDADANGAYNIARKGLMCIRDIKNTDDEKLKKVNYKLSIDDFLNFIQDNE